MESMSIQLACVCHMGLVRHNNEDNFYFAGQVLAEKNTGSGGVLVQRPLPGELPVTAAVFDGMGGEARGETAAYLAAQTLRACLERDPKAPVDQMLVRMNEAVYQEEVLGRITAMGCTAVLARFWGGWVEVANVGDSRALLFRDGQIVQLSEDHTDAAFLKELGITGRSPRLTQYLGMDPNEVMIEPHIIEEPLRSGDILLLCSDGLTGMATEEELTACLNRRGTPEALTRELQELALAHGGRDNITIIVAMVK